MCDWIRHPPEAGTLGSPFRGTRGTRYWLQIQCDGWAVVGKHIVAPAQIEGAYGRWVMTAMDADADLSKSILDVYDIAAHGDDSLVFGGGTSPDGKWWFGHTLDNLYAWNPVTKEHRHASFTFKNKETDRLACERYFWH
ncbi:hypothetical protein [Streptomyces chartreusis]|uniref:hypothetical protein n=1 Tax=Streptomyces chartreusis TaxID=1969 RepID=UPI002E1947A7